MAANAIYSVLGRVAGLGVGPGLNQVNLVIGVEKEIQILSDELKRVINVLDDAEKKGCKDKLVRDWLTRLENTTYEMDDVLDEWNAAIRERETEQHSFDNVLLLWLYKVRSFIPSSCLLCFEKVVVRRNIALKVKEVVARLDLILAEKDRYGFATTPQPSDRELWRGQTTSFIDLEEIYGRELEREDVVRQLVGEGGSSEEGLIGGIRVISIVGVGGLGKTTLAQLAYNNSQVMNYFELRIWISVSDPFNEVEIAKGIVASVEKLDEPPRTNQLEMLLQRLKKSISGKKFLLVMDDVWTEDDIKWKPLKNALKSGGTGSKVLVTTRNERVAIMMMGEFINNNWMIHRLGVLNDEDCWSLLGRIALCGKNKYQCEEFENTGKQITKKCNGLPLAAKTLGSLLRFKTTLEEWESVLNSEIWKLEEVKDDLFRHLFLSYNELSPTLKRCFSYCAVFPKDTIIYVDELIIKWRAMGYLGSNAVDDWKVRGRGCFNNLTMRSLFQDFKKDGNKIESFMMHDIVHDFAQFLRKDVGSRIKKTTCEECSPLLVSQVEKYRSSLFQGKEVLDPHVCDCLTSVRLLDLRRCGLQAIPKEIEKLIHLRWLNLSYNEFAGDDLKSICKLYNLEFLWVDRCGLQEIPLEIGNLSELIHLDLSWNRGLRELPESLCNLSKLESLDVNWCESLRGLPRGIHRLKKLKHLYNEYTYSLKQYPQGISQLTSLVTLNKVLPCDGSQIGWLTNLNRLSGEVKLRIEIRSCCDSVEVVVEDAREAELGKKTQIQELIINFDVKLPSPSTSVWNEVLDALHPHPNLQQLTIRFYNGSRLPGWIVSPLNQLTSIGLYSCEFLVSLPPLGKLPLLETLWIEGLPKLEYVGREFLGIVTCSSMGTIDGGFPKLKKLSFGGFNNWKKWEDITVEEEEEDNVAISIMPCLTKLTIRACWRLMDLPQRLMRKVSSLKRLDIYGSKLVDALEPHPNLHKLKIYNYEGSQLPRWITSPLNQLTYVELAYCDGLLLLPPLGKLPLLETLLICGLSKLEYVGREFLGIATTTSSCSSGTNNIIYGGFPKLKKLSFWSCPKWNKWEDITTAQEEEEEYSIMPCLTELTIYYCNGLTELPQRLLRKVSSPLKKLDIKRSTQLIQVYGDKEGQPWESISRHNPHLLLYPRVYFN
ncbi:PREDICTED: putative disease resistance protein RGA3 [Erythranthe guttata]|uniref:putative disease resistance protein RGA3 n=1 Tax=Erythranthe guttata TaxID=4155 RepID=UPI00064DFD7D|nr:PREDICTED: putative disease resistance protein RGA3 [Erythranthe guttata]|eukprot:XP_012856114.1 PREDICTED: putative disease resistance protein RGA3 [Erythranthe guttata]